jgi:hypothetical protein
VTDEDLLTAFEAELGKHIPGFEIRYKDQSKLMAVLGFLTAPFNPLFMTDFVTTWGKAVFFPNRQFVADRPLDSVAVLAHEFVHLWDEKAEGPLKYKHAYVAPQVYGLLTLLAFAIFFTPWPLVQLLVGYLVGCAIARKKRIAGLVTIGAFALGALLVTGLTTGVVGLLALVGSVVPLAPWPSRGRTRLESRGYAMTVAMQRWLTGEDMNPETLAKLRNYFTGPDYYFMSWSKTKIDDVLVDAAYGARTGSLADTGPYQVVADFLEEHGRLFD